MSTAQTLPSEKDAVAHLADLVGIAASQVGVGESPRGSNRGAALAKFFASDDYKPAGKDEGYPWCAAFVCWCIQTWLALGAASRFRIEAPRTARAFGFIDWARTQRAVQYITRAELLAYRYRPAPGDIVVFECSHVALCSKSAPKGYVTTIDGNTNPAGGREGYEVAIKTRPVGKVRCVLRLIPTAKNL